MTMILIFGAILAVLVAILVGRRVPWSPASPDMGYVSQQWLAEYRASHPL